MVDLANTSSDDDAPYPGHFLAPLCEADQPTPPRPTVAPTVPATPPLPGSEEFPAQALGLPAPIYSQHRAQVFLSGTESLLPFTLPESAVGLISRAFSGAGANVENLELVHNLYVTGAIPGITKVYVVLTKF